MVIEAWFGHCLGWLPWNSSTKIPMQMTSRCSIVTNVRTNAVVECWGFLFWAAISWSHSSQRTPVVCYMVNWWPFTTVWIYSDPTPCYLIMLLSVFRMIFKWTSWVIFLIAAFAVSQWTNWCLQSCCLPKGDVFDKMPANWLDLHALSPDWGGHVSMIRWCGI